MAKSNLLSMETLEEPTFDPDKLNFFEKGKIRVIIYYEDGSHKVYMLRLSKSYFFEINKSYYLIVPRCISRGNKPTISYYFNNPAPIEIGYQKSSLKADSFRNKKELDQLAEDQKTLLVNTYIDAEALKSAMTSRLLQGLYKDSKLSLGALMLIVGAVLLVILILLHVTGTVDVVAFITGG